MTHDLTCTACGATVAIDPRDCGTHVACPDCQATLDVPTLKLAVDSSQFTASGDLAAGVKVAGFTIEHRLGSGGMGTVYRARQVTMHRTVALKILPVTLAHDPGNIERFQQEVRLQALLDHPNIVPAFEAGFDAGHYYLAMHYVDGRSLGDRLASESRLGVPVALRYARQIAVALDYAWREHHLLHRDLKPQNIMIDRRDSVRLLDLGIAKCIDENAALTQSGIICGTPHYMSPEQARGSRDLDCRSDIYALGATLYHLVTGSTPYQGQTSLEVLHKHAYEPLQDAHMRNPEVARKVSAFISTLMAKDPADRPADWADVADRIDHLLGPGTEVGIPVPRLSPPPSARVDTGRHPASGAPRSMTNMVKGFIAGCILWLVVLGTFMVFVAWGCVSCMSGCTVSPGGPPPAAHMDDLSARTGDTFALQRGVLTLGPAETTVAWFTETAYSRRRVALRLRLDDGSEGGFLIWPEGTTGYATPNDAVRVVLQRTDDAGGQAFLVQRRVEGTLVTLATIDRPPNADGWHQLMVTYGPQADLTLTFPDGTSQTVADAFSATRDSDGDTHWPDRAWGVFAAPEATVRVEILDPSRFDTLTDADAATEDTAAE